MYLFTAVIVNPIQAARIAATYPERFVVSAVLGVEAAGVDGVGAGVGVAANAYS